MDQPTFEDDDEEKKQAKRAKHAECQRKYREKKKATGKESYNEKNADERAKQRAGYR